MFLGAALAWFLIQAVMLKYLRPFRVYSSVDVAFALLTTAPFLGDGFDMAKDILLGSLCIDASASWLRVLGVGCLLYLVVMHAVIFYQGDDELLELSLSYLPILALKPCDSVVGNGLQMTTMDRPFFWVAIN